MAGKRRRTRGWSAAVAARAAVHIRDEMLSRHRGNPYVLALATDNAQRTISRWQETLAHLGGTVEERTWMALNELAGLDLDPHTPDLPRAAAREQIDQEHEGIASAELYVVSPSMHATVVAAAQTIDPRELITLPIADDIPSPAGLVLLPSVQLVDRVHGGTADVRALSWRTAAAREPTTGDTHPLAQIVSWVDADGPLQYPDFIALRRLAADQGHPLPGLISEYYNYLRLDAYERPPEELAAAVEAEVKKACSDDRRKDRFSDVELTGEFAGETVDDSEGSFASRYLYAFWRLCTQQLVTVDRRADVDHAGTAPTPDEEDVQIVQLRSVSDNAGTDDAAPNRTYRNRWVVRMHKVRQWYPSENTHKLLWRGPYVKGPDGAPLLTAEKVNALMR